MRRIRDIPKASALAKQGRLPVFLACMLLVSFLVALVPFEIHVGISDTCDSKNKTRCVYLEKCESFAMTPGDTAKEFVKVMAQSAGLTVPELIVTTCGIAAVGSGMVLVSDAGQDWGQSAGEALSSIVDAADYPDWETLDSEHQTLWGSRENYDSAKYVSLMHGLGMSTEYERFEQMQGSGGANFEFSDDVQDRLNQFYRIGNLWKSRLGVMFEDIHGLIYDKMYLKNFPVGVPLEGHLYDGSQDENWPEGVPTQLVYSIGNSVTVASENGNFKTYYARSSSGVYWIMAHTGVSGNYWGFSIYAFDKNGFLYGTSTRDPNVNPTSAAGSTTGANQEFYYTYLGGSVSVATGETPSVNIPYNVFNISSGNADRLKMRYVMGKILASDSGGTTAPADGIIDYPDGDVSNDQRIYFPENGVTPESTWQNFTDPQTPNPDNQNPYNPDNQSGSMEWKTDTEENLLAASEFPLNKLFPFSLLYDITTLANKVKSVTVEQQTSGAYDVISIPINLPWLQDTIDIDLGDLHDLLLGTRVFIQILLATSLLFATIRLWSGVLGGQ